MIATSHDKNDFTKLEACYGSIGADHGFCRRRSGCTYLEIMKKAKASKDIEIFSEHLKAFIKNDPKP
jgi:hypothetical protein